MFGGWRGTRHRTGWLGGVSWLLAGCRPGVWGLRGASPGSSWKCGLYGEGAEGQSGCCGGICAARKGPPQDLSLGPWPFEVCVLTLRGPSFCLLRALPSWGPALFPEPCSPPSAAEPSSPPCCSVQGPSPPPSGSPNSRDSLSSAWNPHLWAETVCRPSAQTLQVFPPLIQGPALSTAAVGGGPGSVRLLGGSHKAAV